MTPTRYRISMTLPIYLSFFLSIYLSMLCGGPTEARQEKENVCVCLLPENQCRTSTSSSMSKHKLLSPSLSLSLSLSISLCLSLSLSLSLSLCLLWALLVKTGRTSLHSSMHLFSRCASYVSHSLLPHVTKYVFYPESSSLQGATKSEIRPLRESKGPPA